MQDAISFQAINARVEHCLTPRIVEMRVPDISLNVEGFGIGGTEMRWETVNINVDRRSMLVAIVFCLPGSKIAIEEILPHLEYLNERSDNFIDFYFPGYGTGWPPGHYTDQKTVGTLDGVELFFSAKPFNKLRLDLEAITKWRYSEETDLILLTGKRNSAGTGELCFSPSHACNLERMANDKAFSSVRSFFGEIVRLCESYMGDDPIWFLSDKYGGKIGMDFLKSALLSLLPAELATSYRKVEHYAIRDISI